jgi:MoxR-like ATPase
MTTSVSEEEAKTIGKISASDRTHMFFKVYTQVTSGKLKKRLKAIEQSEVMIDKTLSVIRPGENLQCDNAWRENYKVDDIVAVPLSLISDKNSHYCAKGLDIDRNAKLCSVVDIKSRKVDEVYTEYVLSTGSFVEIVEKPIQEELPAIKTFYDEIRDKFPCPNIKKDGVCIDESIWFILIRNALRGQPSLLVGPAGTGKTLIAMKVAEALELDLFLENLGASIDPIASLCGVHRIDSTGSSVYDLANFAKNIPKRGVTLLDELSRAPHGTTNVLLPVLDWRKELPLALAGGDDDRVVKLHDEHAFIATANVGIEYTGTNVIDAALTSRMFILELDYMNSDQETDFLSMKTGIHKSVCKKIADVAAKIRGLYKKGELSACVDTRETLQCATLVADGFDLVMSMEQTFLIKFEGSKSEQGSERNSVYNLIRQKN